MINENMTFTKKETKVYDPLPERSFTVELLDLIVERKPKYKKPDEIEDTLKCVFVILRGVDKNGDPLRGRFISRNYIPTFFYISTKTGKNVLYQIVEALLGRNLTPEEEAEGVTSEFINSLIGKQCGVIIKHKKKDDKTFSNIESFFITDDRAEALSKDERNHLLEIIEKQDEAKTSSAEIEASHSDEDEIAVDNIPF